jgi:GDPmannose 4,6-dehydratase
MYGVYLMMTQDQPDDYILATGQTYTIRQMLDIAFGYIDRDWTKYVAQDKNLLRPSEVHILLGDASKARKKLNWMPRMNITDIFEEIIEADIARCKAYEINVLKRDDWTQTMRLMAN